MKINFIIFIIIFIIIIVIILITNYTPDLSDFGTYSKTVTNCISENGYCSSEGFQFVISECIPNKLTGRGCLINNQQTFRTLIHKDKCIPKCILSYWGNIEKSDCILSDTDKKFFEENNCLVNKPIGKTFTKMECLNKDSTGLNKCIINLPSYISSQNISIENRVEYLKINYPNAFSLLNDEQIIYYTSSLDNFRKALLSAYITKKEYLTNEDCLIDPITKSIAVCNVGTKIYLESDCFPVYPLCGLWAVKNDNGTINPTNVPYNFYSSTCLYSNFVDTYSDGFDTESLVCVSKINPIKYYKTLFCPKMRSTDKGVSLKTPIEYYEYSKEPICNTNTNAVLYSINNLPDYIPIYYCPNNTVYKIVQCKYFDLNTWKDYYPSWMFSLIFRLNRINLIYNNKTYYLTINNYPLGVNSSLVYSSPIPPFTNTYNNFKKLIDTNYILYIPSSIQINDLTTSIFIFKPSVIIYMKDNQRIISKANDASDIIVPPSITEGIIGRFISQDPIGYLCYNTNIYFSQSMNKSLFILTSNSIVPYELSTIPTVNIINSNTYIEFANVKISPITQISYYDSKGDIKNLTLEISVDHSTVGEYLKIRNDRNNIYSSNLYL